MAAQAGARNIGANRRIPLRVALLTLLEPASDGSGPCGLIKVCGRSLARQQMALALALGCQRVIAIAVGLSPALVAMQHEAEGMGAKFHAVTGINGVLALVNKGDEVLAMADGLLVDPERVRAMIAGGPMVAVQSADVGVAAGFERIDAERASAGVICLPAEVFAGSLDMPADCDVFSTLQRMALQAGIRRVAMSVVDQSSGPWQLIGSDAAAHALEQQWLGAAQPVHKPLTCERILTRWCFQAFAPALLHAGSSAFLLPAVALVLAGIALVMGWFGWGILALALWTLGWIAQLTANSLRQFEQQMLLAPAAGFRLEAVYAGLFDALLAMLVVAIIPPDSHLTGWIKAYFSLLLLGVLRLVPRLFSFSSAAWLQDRVVLVLVLILASFLGNVATVVPVLTLFLIAAAILQTLPKK